MIVTDTNIFDYSFLKFITWPNRFFTTLTEERYPNNESLFSGFNLTVDIAQESALAT